MQNSPQFVVAYYAILRASAVVVPVNPMHVTDELGHYLEDSGAKVAIVGQELYEQISPLSDRGGLEHVITAAYSDYVEAETDLAVPDFVTAPKEETEGAIFGAKLLRPNVRPRRFPLVPKIWRSCLTPPGRRGNPRDASTLTAP